MTDQLSPCCGATLELVSPPNNYECPECLAEFDLDDEPFDEGEDENGDEPVEAIAAEDDGDGEALEDDPELAEADDQELCGTEMSDGSTCTRPADECPYHDQEEEP